MTSVLVSTPETVVRNAIHLYATELPNMVDDVYFSCFRAGEQTFVSRLDDHSLMYIDSGTVTVSCNGKTEEFGTGSCLFFQRNNTVSIVKRPGNDGQPFRSIVFVLQRKFLKEQLKQITIPTTTEPASIPAISVLTDKFITALFASLSVYLDNDSSPSTRLLELKKEEALWALLQINRTFYRILFDFSNPWKVDLETFMNETYKDNLSLGQLSTFTARSLSSFKRDFQKQFSTTPKRWVVKRRLQEAHRLLAEQQQKPSDVYLDLGFKNLAHFSTAFKREYGISPSHLTKR